MEFDALAQLEHPLLGIGRGFEALGEIGNNLALGCNVGEARAQGTPGDDLIKGVGNAAGIKRVAGRSTSEAEPEAPALFRLCPRHGGIKGLGGGNGDAGGHGLLDEFAPRQAARPGESLQPIERHVLSPVLLSLS